MESAAESSQKRKRRRPPWEKWGKMRYIYRHIKRIENTLDRLEKRQRIILDALGQLTLPSKDFLTLVVCKEEVDIAILNQLYQAGHKGLYPVVITESLSEYGLSLFLVSHRRGRMNKTLKKVRTARGREARLALGLNKDSLRDLRRNQRRNKPLNSFK